MLAVFNELVILFILLGTILANSPSCVVFNAVFVRDSVHVMLDGPCISHNKRLQSTTTDAKSNGCYTLYHVLETNRSTGHLS